MEEFPNFTKLHIGHKDHISTLTSQFEPYSDFHFTSLFSWNTDDSTEVALLANNLVIKLPDYISGEPVVSILGSNITPEVLDTLLAEYPYLKLVPEAAISHLHALEEYEISEDEDNADYVYQLESLAKLAGKAFKKKRNKVNSVATAFDTRLACEIAQKIDDKLRKEIEEVFRKWAKASKQSESEIAPELSAISTLLDHADKFDLIITLVRLDGKLVGFSINEKVDDAYAICHFEKAVPVHPQIFSYIANQAAHHLLLQGCKFVNWEQDLGILTLREAKRHYNPHNQLKKYTVRKKSAKK